MEVEWGQAGEIIRPQWRFDFSDGKKKGMLDGTVLDHHAILRKVCQGHQKLLPRFQNLAPSRGALPRGHSLERVHSESHTHARAVRQKGRQCCLLQEPKNQNLVSGKAKKGG